MKANFSDAEIIYLYGLLLRSLAELENESPVSRSDVRLHQQLIAALERDNPQLKMIGQHYPRSRSTAD